MNDFMLPIDNLFEFYTTHIDTSHFPKQLAVLKKKKKRRPLNSWSPHKAIQK
jgi:hypothetical protein